MAVRDGPQPTSTGALMRVLFHECRTRLEGRLADGPPPLSLFVVSALRLGQHVAELGKRSEVELPGGSKSSGSLKKTTILPTSTASGGLPPTIR